MGFQRGNNKKMKKLPNNYNDIDDNKLMMMMF